MPPVKIKKAGKDVDDVWKLLLANVRTPRDNMGDFRALIAAIDLGERRMTQLVRKYGKENFRDMVSALMDYSERRMRAEIAAFPDGRYVFEDYMEDDGIEDKPYKIAVAEVVVQGDEIVVDYTARAAGEGPDQRDAGRGVERRLQRHPAADRSFDPEELRMLPADPVLAPPGTVVNVDFPGPSVGGNTETHCRIAYAVMGALAPARQGRARPPTRRSFAQQLPLRRN